MAETPVRVLSYITYISQRIMGFQVVTVGQRHCINLNDGAKVGLSCFGERGHWL